jgi:hypothetical protein
MSDNFERPHASGEGIGLTQPEFEKSETAFADHRSAWGSTLRRQLPYILVLWLAIVGVAYTNMAHQPLVGCSEFLALATGLVCVVTEWPKLDDRQGRFRLIWTPAPGLGIIASVVMLGFGLWWLGRAEAAARRAGETFGAGEPRRDGQGHRRPGAARSCHHRT